MLVSYKKGDRHGNWRYSQRRQWSNYTYIKKEDQKKIAINPGYGLEDRLTAELAKL
jgi:hypothetical protein